MVFVVESAVAGFVVVVEAAYFAVLALFQRAGGMMVAARAWSR